MYTATTHVFDHIKTPGQHRLVLLHPSPYHDGRIRVVRFLDDQPSQVLRFVAGDLCLWDGAASPDVFAMLQPFDFWIRLQQDAFIEVATEGAAKLRVLVVCEDTLPRHTRTRSRPLSTY